MRRQQRERADTCPLQGPGAGGTRRGHSGQSPLPAQRQAAAPPVPSCPASGPAPPRPQRSPDCPPRRLRSARGARLLPVPRPPEELPRPGRAGPTSPPGAALPTRLSAPPSPAEGPPLPAPSLSWVRGVPAPRDSNGPQQLGVRPWQSRRRPCVPLSRKPPVETDLGALLTRHWTCLCPSSAG